MTLLHSTSSSALGAVALLVASGCGAGRTPEPVQPVGETHTSASSTGGARPQGEDTPKSNVGVIIGSEVRTRCGMPDEPEEPTADTPRFEFEGGRLRPRGEDILQRVAACVTSGKLGPETLRVIGYADPRASDDYAYQLGTYRAAGGKQRLVDLGVPANKVTIESRGNADARGNDDASWALDRRVEIHFVGAGPAPLLDRGKP